jgi:CHRD domain
MNRCMTLVAAAAALCVSSVAQGQSLFRAIQTGAQEVPPTPSTATGTLDAILIGGPGSYSLSFSGAYTGLGTPYSASHLHQGAIGAAGPVVLNLAANHTPSSPTSGSWQGRFVPISDALATSLMAGTIYINTHSNGFPGGEIRGQMLPITATPFRADQNGAQETPPVVTPGTGFLDLVLAGGPGAYQISFVGNYSGLLGNYSASHLHQAPVGVAGPVVVNLAAAHAPNTPTSGSWLGFAVPISDVLAANLIAGNLYINTHSSLFPGGEIRGQLGAPAGPCYADCDGDGVLSIDDFICFQTFFALGC